MTASPHDDFLRSFVAAATAGGDPPETWMRALTIAPPPPRLLTEGDGFAKTDGILGVNSGRWAGGRVGGEVR